MRLTLLLAATTAVSTVFAAPANTTSVHEQNYYQTVTPQSAEEACRIWGQWYAEHDGTRAHWINPVIPHKCLHSMPYDDVEAKALVELAELGASFISMLPFAKANALPALEMGSYDLNATLLEIRNRVTSEKPYYTDMYTFWHDLYRAFGRLQDGHTIFLPSCVTDLAAYYHDYPIANFNDEIWTVKMEKGKDHNENGLVDMQLVKKVEKINGKPAVEYLRELSAADRLMMKLQDPDARWNQLMVSWPLTQWNDRFGLPTNNGLFAFRQTWDEKEDALELEFEGGQKEPVQWKATAPYYSSLEFTTATELRDLNCMEPKESTDTASTRKRAVEEEDEGAWTEEDESTSDIVGYPEPDSRGPEDAALVFIDETDPTNTTAILRLSTFSLGIDRAHDQYMSYITTVIPTLTLRGYTRLIIDITENDGGYSDLAKVIRQTLFSESQDHHTPGRLRWNPTLDAAYSQHDVKALSEEYATPEGKNFTTVREWLGPYRLHDDLFTALHSLRSETEPLGKLKLPSKNLYAPEDVVVLTDGHCHSTCHIMVEALTHPEIGARTFTLGGRPGTKGIQAVGGTKGGSNTIIEKIMEIYVAEGNKEIEYRTRLLTQFNIEDQYRDNDDDETGKLPLQYRWTPACRRVPYEKKEMLTDVREVWRVVREKAWGDDGEECECDEVEEPGKKEVEVDGQAEEGVRKGGDADDAEVKPPKKNKDDEDEDEDEEDEDEEDSDDEDEDDEEIMHTEYFVVGKGASEARAIFAAMRGH